MTFTHIAIDDALLTSSEEATHVRDVAHFTQPLVDALAALPYMQGVWGILSDGQKTRLAFELHVQLRLREFGSQQPFEPALVRCFIFTSLEERTDFLMRLHHDLTA